MKAVYKLFSFLGIVLYLLGPLAAPAAALATQRLFYATPDIGSAPLTVTFTSNGMVSSNFYRIDFGDGKVSEISTLQTPHTYSVAGTYTAQFMYAPNQCTGATAACPQSMPNWQVLDTSTVSVAAPTTGSGGTNGKTPPTCQLTLNTSSIQVGGSVTLKWTSTNATGGAITNVGNVDPVGQANLLPSSASYTTYQGSFTGPGGTANCSATVTVMQGTGSGGGGTDGGTGGGITGGTGDGTTPPPVIIQSAPQNALVTCGTGIFQAGDTTKNNSTGCQACDLATLVQNIINFLIGLSIPIAAALFAYAGILYFTSGADHHNIDKAKGIFRNAFVGFVIVITAWLVINTVLHVIFSQSTFVNGNWFTIQCSQSPRPVTGSIGDVLANILGKGNVLNNTVSTTGSNFGTVCPDGSAPSVTETGNYCVNSNGTVTAATGGGGTNTENSVSAAASSYYNSDTSAGPDGGNLACAWAVNNVLQSAGIPTIDGNSVASMEQVLQSGRGTSEDQSGAHAGDIVIFGGGLSHVGICYNSDCSQVISNSSSNARFNNIGPPPSGSRYYKLNN